MTRVNLAATRGRHVWTRESVGDGSGGVGLGERLYRTSFDQLISQNISIDLRSSLLAVARTYNSYPLRLL